MIRLNLIIPPLGCHVALLSSVPTGGTVIYCQSTMMFDKHVAIAYHKNTKRKGKKKNFFYIVIVHSN